MKAWLEKLVEIGNLASLQVNLNGVFYFEERIRVVDGLSTMGHQMRDFFMPKKLFLILHNLYLPSSYVNQIAKPLLVS